MRLVVLVNDVGGIMADQTTALLALRARQRDWEVWLSDVAQLQIAASGEIRARAWPAAPPAEPQPWLRATQAATPRFIGLEAGDRLLIRTNAARDAQRAALHDAALGICGLARGRGTVVLNSPEGLRRANSKLYLSHLPAWTRPETLISAQPEALAGWVRSQDQQSVLKPLAGTQGTDVFRVGPADDGNLRQICQVVTRRGYGVAQAYLPDAPAGDTRLILVDGKLLTVQGQRAAISRVPGQGEFRSNVAQGGSAKPATWRPAWDAVVDAVGPILAADGLWLVGLDMVGDKIVEANVSAPGGFGDAEAFYGVDFTGAALDSLAAQASA